DRYDTMRVSTTRETTPATSPGTPHPWSTGVSCGAIVEAPNAEEKNPAKVTPICTAERNKPESLASPATVRPAPFDRSRRMSCDPRQLTTAVSAAANARPMGTNTSTSRAHNQTLIYLHFLRRFR